MLFPEILHGASPVNVGQQPGIAEAHSPQRFGRAHVKRLLRERLPPRVVNGIKRYHPARHGDQQHCNRHQVYATRRSHFRFRR